MTEIIEGNVQYQLPEENQWRTLKQGQKLPFGVQVWTSRSSSAKLSIGSSVSVSLDELTSVALQLPDSEKQGRKKMEHVLLALDAGHVKGRLEGEEEGIQLQVISRGGKRAHYDADPGASVEFDLRLVSESDFAVGWPYYTARSDFPTDTLFFDPGHVAPIIQPIPEPAVVSLMVLGTGGGFCSEEEGGTGENCA